ncbi:MAG: non-ribosomal peptide synthetase, partial [Nostocaceae cyanobacterium]|nr:non-ribosomal peptide synthetase [Nostocaceae cyanobacterium]
VDRRALPAPETTLLKTFTPPETPLELVIAEIWKEVLGTEQVGVNDNFFELGGHSLLAMQVLMEIYEMFGVDLQLSAFFKNSTLTEFALAIALSHHNPATVEKTAQLLLQLTELSEAEVEERMTLSQEVS